MLNNLSEETKDEDIKSKLWTKLTEADHWALVAEIKATSKTLDWTLNENWQLDDA